LFIWVQWSMSATSVPRKIMTHPIFIWVDVNLDHGLLQWVQRHLIWAAGCWWDFLDLHTQQDSARQDGQQSDWSLVHT
jgi:Na_Pro_sym: sodium/proline symporter